MIVIPMAGFSARFRDAGYNKPKFMLSLHGRSVFSHAVGSFQSYFDAEQFVFVARGEEGTKEFVEQEVRALGIRSAAIVIIDHPTRGQADTVRIGLQRFGRAVDEPLTIFNIDTFRPKFRFPDADWVSAADGIIEVMIGNDPSFSFVLPSGDGEQNKVAGTAEKEVISDLASTGLYWFRSARLFCDSVDRARTELQVASELYVAPLYNLLLRDGFDVRFNLVSERDVIFCGVPAQYEQLVRGKPYDLFGSDLAT